ncbi:MAG: hypothetical protein PVI33_06020 [Candidatus Omnitrophota bacterium]
MSGGDILTDRWLTGSGNTLIGENVAGAGNLAHSSGSDGWYNTALGYNALYSNTTGFHNTAVGWNALEDNTTGYYNTAIGSQALMNNTGSFNVAVGYAALDSLSSNSDNVAVGTQALRGLLSGGGNVCVGGDAMTDLTTGSSNVGVGYGVLDNITTTCCNTAVGFRAGLGVSANTFSDNSLFGYQSGLGLTVGNNNVLLGYKSGDSITTGSNNIIIGYDEDTPTATTSNHLNIGGALYGDLSTGNIGIGKTDPNRQLSIKGDNGIGIIHSNDQANYIYTNTNGQLVFGSQSSDDYIWMDDDTGDVGIGTSNPGSKLEVAGTSSTISNSTGDLTITPAGDLIISSGNVGIGTTNPTATLEINGNIKADLNDVTNSNALYATGTGAGAEIGYDVAELFEANEEVEIGDVLVIDENGKLKKSTKSYDSKVAGIVSGAPAILFEGGQLQIAPEPFEFKSGVKPPLALAGRVYVKATAENGLIKPGDLLTTSDRQGYAMLAKEHKPGTILGKALENLNEGEGRILVLVTLQ